MMGFALLNPSYGVGAWRRCRCCQAHKKCAYLAPGCLGGLFSMSNVATAVSAGDTAWVLTASALVLFMTLPGLALFYGGLVRARNLLSVLMHCFVICCVVSVLWVSLRLQPRLRAGRAAASAAVGKAVPRQHLEPVLAGTQVPEGRLRAVSDDVRGDHPGADRRRLCRAHLVSVPDPVRDRAGW